MGCDHPCVNILLDSAEHLATLSPSSSTFNLYSMNDLLRNGFCEIPPGRGNPRNGGRHLKPTGNERAEWDGINKGTPPSACTSGRRTLRLTFFANRPLRQLLLPNASIPKNRKNLMQISTLAPCGGKRFPNATRWKLVRCAVRPRRSRDPRPRERSRVSCIKSLFHPLSRLSFRH